MAAVFMAILVVVAAGLWSYAREAANRSYDRLLRSAALAILERCYLDEGEIRVDLPWSALETLGLAENDRVFYRIYTDSGETITGTPDLPFAREWRAEDVPVFRDGRFSGEKVRFLLQSRLLTGDQTAKRVIVELAQTRLARSELEQDLFWRGFALALFITLVGLSFVWIAISRALHPLIHIERDLRRRDAADFTPLPPARPREIASLVGSINGYIARLKNNLDHSRVFIADVTHQIRTALSALQGQLELASEESDPARMAERLGKAERQSRQTIRLTNQLLSHAMVIHRGDHHALAPVRLVPVLRESLESMVREHLKSRIEFTASIDPGLECRSSGAVSDESAPDSITGDPVSLREALRNMIDNAIRHGPADNRITLSLLDRDTHIALSVEDAGPGIPESAREQALERFYSSLPGGEGSGLGLSIVQEVARSHQAALTLAESADGGLAITLLLPKTGARP